MGGHQRQEIVPVAGNEEKAVFIGVFQGIKVNRRDGENLPEFHYLVSLTA